MARVTQVVLTKAKSFQDTRRRFKQNVPVTMSDDEARRYKTNSYFSVRVVDDKRADVGISAQKINPGDPFNAPVSDESTRLPSKRKKKVAAKRLTTKQGE